MDIGKSGGTGLTHVSPSSTSRPFGGSRRGMAPKAIAKAQIGKKQSPFRGLQERTQTGNELGRKQWRDGFRDGMGSRN